MEEVPLHKLFFFADELDYLLMLGGTLGAAVHGLAMPIFILILGKLLNTLGELSTDPHKMHEQVSKYSLYFVYLATVSLFASWAEVACWLHTGERQVATLRIKYLEAVLKQDVSYFDVQARTGDVVDTISIDTLTIQEAISEKMGNFIHYFFTFVGGFIVGFATVWQLGLITLAILPLIATFGAAYTVSLTGFASKSQAAYSQAGNIAEEVIGQIRTVHSFCGEARAVLAYSVALGPALKLGYKGGLAKGLGVGSMSGFVLSSWAVLLWYGGVLVRNGSADGGSVLSTIFAVMLGGLSLGQAAPNLAAFAKAKVAASKILEMTSRAPEFITVNLEEERKLSNVQGHIQLREVCFSYPSRPDVEVLKSFSLDIPAGQSVAIVGRSGSGKSTVVSLIERFYDPTSGQVLLDGVDIKELHLPWLRTRIGLVSQEPVLFATTIQENILYGNPHATNEQVEVAARAANAHSFICQLPDGYRTKVGERGIQLSGGQKQRIAIARAVVKNPSVLLLDEATSALDAESERTVQNALHRLATGRTTVIVAHRLSTIQNSDKIAVVEDGREVESGRHNELMSRNGAYAALVCLQEVGENAYCSTNHRLENSPRSSTSGFRSPKKHDFEVSKPVGDKASQSGAYFWRLLKLNMPEWPLLLLGSLAAILAGFVNPTFAYLISEVLKFYYQDPETMKSEVAKYSIVFACNGIAVFLIHTVQHWSFALSGETLTKRVREMMFAAITSFEVGWFDREENASTQVASKLAVNAAYVRAAMGDRIGIVVQNMSLLVSAMVVSYIIQWRMSLVVTATLPVLVFSFVLEQLFLKGFAGDMEKSHERASRLAGDAVSNIRVVAAFNAEDKVVELVKRELEVPRKTSLLRGNVAGFGFGVGSFSMLASMSLALWYGGLLIEQGNAKFGDVVKAFFVLVLTSIGIAETLGLSPDIAKAGQAVKSVFQVLDRKSETRTNDPSAKKVEELRGEIEFKMVSFCYPSRPQVTVLHDLSFQIEAGRSLALVGASGSGKSSVVALVERFYDPNAGQVLVDGMDVKQLNLESYRKHIGLVQQEPCLFAASIYDNICYGGDNASEAQAVEAAKAANAHGFIAALPRGYHTSVGERGAQLSGGQKQRVAIARAILRRPSVLLLDEATSALDSESEALVHEALDRLMQKRTSILVAHRLSTVRNADYIAVMEQGRIVDLGNHRELLARPNGAYARLVHLQQQP